MSASDRRRFLRSLAALPAASVMSAASASPASVDPIISLRAEHQALGAVLHNAASDDAETDEAFDRRCAIQQTAMTVRATTLGGAIASLEWAIEENDYTRSNGVLACDFVESLMQGALGVLRRAAVPIGGGT